jgi:hypothetical protein
VERGNAVVGKAAGEWSRRRESNLQPPVYKTGALPLSYAGENESPITGGEPPWTFQIVVEKEQFASVRATGETAEASGETTALVAPRGLEPRTN